MYTVMLLPVVEKTLAKIRDRRVRAQLIQLIDELAETPRPHGYKKLSGHANLYRVRQGDWRVSYAIKDDQLIVLVIEVATRGNAYRDL